MKRIKNQEEYEPERKFTGFLVVMVILIFANTAIQVFYPAWHFAFLASLGAIGVYVIINWIRSLNS